MTNCAFLINDIVSATGHVFVIYHVDHGGTLSICLVDFRFWASYVILKINLPKRIFHEMTNTHCSSTNVFLAQISCLLNSMRTMGDCGFVLVCVSELSCVHRFKIISSGCRMISCNNRGNGSHCNGCRSSLAHWHCTGWWLGWWELIESPKIDWKNE